MSIVVLLLVCCGVSLRAVAQQPRQVKVSEINVSDIPTIRERVFLIHSILDKGYLCYKNNNLPNTIDVYVPADLLGKLPDLDTLYSNHKNNQHNEIPHIDKNTFGQWRSSIDK